MIKNIKCRIKAESCFVYALKTRRGVKPSNENRYTQTIHYTTHLSRQYPEYFLRRDNNIHARKYWI